MEETTVRNTMHHHTPVKDSYKCAFVYHHHMVVNKGQMRTNRRQQDNGHNDH